MFSCRIRTSLALSLAFGATLAAAHGNEAKPASAAAGGEHGHAAAIGVPGAAGKVDRTVKIDMSDTMRFEPSRIDVKQGETVRFVVRNSGRLKHEFVLGTEAELKEHEALMKKFPEMEHADPNQVSVAAGGSGEVIWRFTKAGPVDFACLQPGHYDAGMKGKVRVAARHP